MTNAEKIQAVLNTLERMEIRSTYDNTNYMLGIYNTLTEVRDDLQAKEGAEDGGEADTE